MFENIENIFLEFLVFLKLYIVDIRIIILSSTVPEIWLIDLFDQFDQFG